VAARQRDVLPCGPREAAQIILVHAGLMPMSDAEALNLEHKPQAAERAQRFNRHCQCATLDEALLRAALREESGDPAFYAQLFETRPHLFSKSPVFLPQTDLAAMQEIVRAIEGVASLPTYRANVEAWMPAIAKVDKGPRGAFMGYDFHLSPDGPKLIEINTNAGGAFLNAFLARAQIACCREVEQGLAGAPVEAFDDAVLDMFEAEWLAQRPNRRLRRIAIIDDNPQAQFLHPEFVLAQRLFERSGIDAVIVDPRDLRYSAGVLWADGEPVDLVYNRLVDFALDEPAHRMLRDAYLDGAVVVTPNPRNHALLADKRNLTILSDTHALRAIGASADAIATLTAGVPRTVFVTRENADTLWGARKSLFFKPACGHGGKAVYRGDKVTKSVWQDIVASNYVAQDVIAPTERTIAIDGLNTQRKLDVRLYTYGGETLLAAARLYQGQTTNFRTPGGGFAPVFFLQS
jgi:hypothetical protein